MMRIGLLRISRWLRVTCTTTKMSTMNSVHRILFATEWIMTSKTPDFQMIMMQFRLFVHIHRKKRHRNKPKINLTKNANPSLDNFSIWMVIKIFQKQTKSGKRICSQNLSRLSRTKLIQRIEEQVLIPPIQTPPKFTKTWYHITNNSKYGFHPQVKRECARRANTHSRSHLKWAFNL